MASENEYCCEDDPNFAVVCAFLEKFGSQIGVGDVDFVELQRMLENVVEVPKYLAELHLKLLRKIKKTVHIDRWEKTLVKVCHLFSSQDAWEVERFGYKKAKLASKVRILKELLEMQFDYNQKFKAEVNKLDSDALRSKPLGRDKSGHAYWCQTDENYQIRVFKEDLDDEKWTLVAKDRAGLVSLINALSDGDAKISSDSAGNEDSNSLSEKPIIDTGQQDSESKKTTPADSGEESNQTKEEDGEPKSTFDENELVSKYKIKNLDVVVSDIVKVSEVIVEPVVTVEGEGSGIDNQCPFVVGDVVEEEVMYFSGRGSGNECLTGNETEGTASAPQINSISPPKECNGPTEEAPADKDEITKKCAEEEKETNKTDVAKPEEKPSSEEETNRPAEEPICVKKTAYVCGDGDDAVNKTEDKKIEEIGENELKTKEEAKVEKEEADEEVEEDREKATQEVSDDRKTTSTKEEEEEEEKESNAKEENESPPPVENVEPAAGDIDEAAEAVQEEKDPLAVSEAEEAAKQPPPVNLTSFSLDFDENAPAPPIPVAPTGMRNFRKRGRPPGVSSSAGAERGGGKRMKLKGRRQVDQALRRSVEQRKERLQDGDSSSSSSDAKDSGADGGKKSAPHPKKNSPGKGNRAESVEAAAKSPPPKKKTPRKSRMLAGLDIPSEQQFVADPPIRQSRRLAQLKIKEQFETKKTDQVTSGSKKKGKEDGDDDDADGYKVDKRKRNKQDKEGQSDTETLVEKKKKKKRKEKPLSQLFNENRPWESSSDDSDDEDAVEEEEEEIIEDEYELVLDLDPKSDHEFSPESDLENDDEDWQPMKRARTARKESDAEEADDCPCQKCGKSDHPEWILLCDKCDNGWHCSCLRPPLLVIPEGEWFCPPCQHSRLLEQLHAKLVEYDKMLNKKEIEDRRKERLAYVGISLNNVLPSKEPAEHRKKKRRLSGTAGLTSSGDESEYSRSDSDSDSDEPIYQLRQRRQAKSYKFNEYDEMIKTAIGEDVDRPEDTAGNLGRGKDIQTIVKGLEPEPKAPNGRSVDDDDDDNDAVDGARRNRPPIGNLQKMLRKKHRKLNSLEIDSEDEDISDEDFRGTSSDSEEEEEEEQEDDDASYDSDDFRGGKGGGRRRAPARRSARARVRRFDADFINDDSDSEEAPRRKKKRSIWDETSESDASGGRRRRAGGGAKKKKKKKKPGRLEDSDLEQQPRQKKSRPRIKYGGLTSSEEEDLGRGRRTRGKKTTYVDTLGSDTDEDVYRKNARKPLSDDDDEDFVANDDDDADEDDKDSAGKRDEDGDDVDDDYEEERMEKRALIVPKIYIKKPSGDRRPTTKTSNRHHHQEAATAAAPEPSGVDLEEQRLQALKRAEMEAALQRTLREAAEELEKDDDLEAQRMAERGLVAEPPPTYLAPPPPPTKIVHEPIVSNVTALIRNDDENDDLSEPPGIALPLFEELGNRAQTPEDARKRRGRGPGKNKRSLEESLASLAGRGAVKGDGKPAIEIAAPPQPFSQAQPAPSVITRMLQNHPGQATMYPIGSIRPKQFATMPDDDSDEPSPSGAAPDSRDSSPHHMPPPMPNHYGGARGPPLGMGYRPPAMNHYPRTMPPPQQHMRAAPHMYHPLPPPPPPHRYPPMSQAPSRAPPMMPYAPAQAATGAPPPPDPYYDGYPPQQPPPPLEDHAMPPPEYESQPYPPPVGQYGGDGGPPQDNGKAYDEDEPEAGGGEFGGLVSYFSSQREDDLES
ncbi:remodeling and spacing factor 1-like [Cylas formicarius]|uniref:remodeling and spacing factor 1-like n=1 Tax=Cylas formicarius TaxID=197179 RepID=UPI002958B332|nr:remodeling and spacing factor 1-like [Cylas formicarius]